MQLRMRSVPLLALLTLIPVWKGRAAQRTGTVAATLECQADAPGGVTAALFREIELSAYRIEELARGCGSALTAGAAVDVEGQVSAWLEILDEVNVVDETLRSISAGRNILSEPQRRAWLDLENEALKLRERARETVDQLERSIIGVRSEQYAQALLETQRHSLRMAAIVAALDYCGQIQMAPDGQFQTGKPEWRGTFRYVEWP